MPTKIYTPTLVPNGKYCEKKSSINFPEICDHLKDVIWASERYVKPQCTIFNERLSFNDEGIIKCNKCIQAARLTKIFEEMFFLFKKEGE